MSDNRKLIYAIIKFLKSELEDGDLSGECAEGVEVGIQCLEAAYNILPDEPFIDVPFSLQDMMRKYMKEYEEAERVVTAEDRAAAEALKNEGNTHMNTQNFGDAIACYTKAIKLDPKNAVYYCNRAAASNKMGSYESAVQDCKTALKYDASYGKAYGRLGLAYANLNQHQEAVNCYKKAVELEPDNESFKTNLKVAEEALATARAAAPQPFQNVDLAMIFTNPNLLSMASQMLANPTMQHMMSNILSGNMNQEAGGGIEVLLQASQQLAQQMENENPALVEQLRRHMSGGGGDASDSQNEQSKPDSSS